MRGQAQEDEADRRLEGRLLPRVADGDFKLKLARLHPGRRAASSRHDGRHRHRQLLPPPRPPDPRGHGLQVLRLPHHAGLRRHGGTTRVVQDAYADVNYFPYARSGPASSRSRSASSACSPAPTCSSSSARCSNTSHPTATSASALTATSFGTACSSTSSASSTASSTAAPPTATANTDKDFAGRVFVHPFKTTDWRSPRLRLRRRRHLRQSHRRPIDGTHFRTDGRSRFYRYATGHGQGHAVRLSPQAYCFWGPFGFMGEYFKSDPRSKARHRRGDETTTRGANSDGWFAQASWVLTGEDASYKWCHRSTTSIR